MTATQKSINNLKKGRKSTLENTHDFRKSAAWKAHEAKLWKAARQELLSLFTGENVIDEELFDYLRERGIGEKELKTCARYIAIIARTVSGYRKCRLSHLGSIKG